MKTKKFILGEMVKDVEVSLNRSATIPFTMKEKVFMVIWEVDIGIGPDPIHTIIHMSLLYRWVS